jgi:DNA replication protein DnaC
MNQTTDKFLTLGDPVLLKMQSAAAEYAASYKNGGGGWLSLLGSSGTGKTFLATSLCRHLGGTVKSWPKFMARMRSGDYHVHESVDALAKCEGVLLLDEIGVGNDRKDFGLDLLFQVIEGRRSRPTLITSNLSLDGLAAIDPRLSSRLMRYGKVIKCDTKDFAMREKPTP